MNAEKWIRRPTAGGTAFCSEINPAYVEELEAFAKEMAEAVTRSWFEVPDGYNVGGCLHCDGACVPDGEQDKYIHGVTCPVPRAEEYLKERI